MIVAGPRTMSAKTSKDTRSAALAGPFNRRTLSSETRCSSASLHERNFCGTIEPRTAPPPSHGGPANTNSRLRRRRPDYWKTEGPSHCMDGRPSLGCVRVFERPLMDTRGVMGV